MLKEFASVEKFVAHVVAEVANPDFTQSDPLILYGIDQHHKWQTVGAQGSFENALRKSVESRATHLGRRGIGSLDPTDFRLLTLFGHLQPVGSKPTYPNARAYEATVCAVAQQILDRVYTLPPDRDDSNMFREHPKTWPLSEHSLRNPSGKRGKDFDGLTYDMRELLKYGKLRKPGKTAWSAIELNAPSAITFGLKALAWFHRDIWQTGLKKAVHRTLGDFMRNYLTTQQPDAHLSADDHAMLSELYGVEGEKAA